ncbi:MAG: hypothetical protein SA339_08330 [Methanomassiliicoccus sp.]|nr:hypothetical protein [Methanomassiliicoccus sp.]
MKRLFLVIGAILAIAILGFAILGPALTKGASDAWDDLNGKDESVQATATIYIADGSGNIMTADVPIGDATPGEAMMLAFGQGIRGVQFEPLSYSASTSKLWFTGVNYQIWGVVNAQLTSNNAQFTKVSATFTGLSGATQRDAPGVSPNHLTSAYKMLGKDKSTSSFTVTQTSGLGNGATVSLNQDTKASDDSDRFCYFSDSVSTSILSGDYVDGSMIKVKLEVYGTTPDGQQSYNYYNADILISASSWDSGYVSASITGMSAGGI